MFPSHLAGTRGKDLLPGVKRAGLAVTVKKMVWQEFERETLEDGKIWIGLSLS
jgi:hypothetical protein